MLEVQLDIRKHFMPVLDEAVLLADHDLDAPLSQEGLEQAIRVAEQLLPCDVAISSPTQYQRTKQSIHQALKYHQKLTGKLYAVFENPLLLSDAYWFLEKNFLNLSHDNLQEDIMTTYYVSSSDSIPSGAAILYDHYNALIQNMELMISMNPDKGLIMHSLPSPAIDFFHLALFDALSFDKDTNELSIDDLRKPSPYQPGQGIMGKMVENNNTYTVQFMSSHADKEFMKVTTLDRLKEQREEFYEHSSLQKHNL